MAVINGPGIFAWAQALPGSNRYTTRVTSGSILSPSELTYANLLVNSRKCKQKIKKAIRKCGLSLGRAITLTPRRYTQRACRTLLYTSIVIDYHLGRFTDVINMTKQHNIFVS